MIDEESSNLSTGEKELITIAGGQAIDDDAAQQGAEELGATTTIARLD